MPEMVSTQRSPRERVIFRSVAPSLTLQQFKDECDINTIMARFRETGRYYDLVSAAKYGAPRVPQFGDFSNLGDALDQASAIREGIDSFMRFPAWLRSEFNNSLGAFVAFLSADDASRASANPRANAFLAELGFFGEAKRLAAIGARRQSAIVNSAAPLAQNVVSASPNPEQNTPPLSVNKN